MGEGRRGKGVGRRSTGLVDGEDGAQSRWWGSPAATGPWREKLGYEQGIEPLALSSGSAGARAGSGARGELRLDRKGLMAAAIGQR